MTIGDVWNKRAEFEISISKWEDDVTEKFERLTFEYANPAVSVDTSGRFVTHEIIGGTTVRQKIGEDPIEVDVSGVCTESKARQLDALRNASYGSITSDRLPGSSLTVQFESVSTSPMSDGGAVPIDQTGNEGVRELLYSFSLSCTEVSAFTQS